MRIVHATCLAVSFWACLIAAAAVDTSKLPPPAKQTGITYVRDVRPMLEVSCFRCHANERPKAGLHLDSLEGVLKGSREGKVVIPGSSEKSQIVISAAQIDPETAMPPKPRPGRGQRDPAARARRRMVALAPTRNTPLSPIMAPQMDLLRNHSHANRLPCSAPGSTRVPGKPQPLMLA